MKRLLFLDTETGGIDPTKYSLLTIGYIVWDRECGVLYSREVCQKLARYRVSREALEINHFDLKKYEKERILTSREIIDEFNLIRSKFFGAKKIPLAGHNISFDVEFLRAMYRKQGMDIEKTFSYKTVDTFTILQFMNHCGRLPDGITSLSKAIDYFHIEINERHTALGDAFATLDLYQKMLMLCKM